MNVAVQANRDVRVDMRELGCSLEPLKHCHRHIPLQSHLSLLGDLSSHSNDLPGCSFRSPTQRTLLHEKHKAVCLSSGTPLPSWASFQLSVTQQL